MVPLLLMLALAEIPPQSPAITGGWLLDLCVAHAPAERAVCNAYLLGFGSGAALHQPELFCAPDPLSLDDMRTRVVKWIRADAQRRKQDAGLAVLYAMKAAYPCGK